MQLLEIADVLRDLKTLVNSCILSIPQCWESTIDDINIPIYKFLFWELGIHQESVIKRRTQANSVGFILMLRFCS